MKSFSGKASLHKFLTANSADILKLLLEASLMMRRPRPEAVVYGVTISKNRCCSTETKKRVVWSSMAYCISAAVS